jgi:hypothetical protein
LAQILATRAPAWRPSTEVAHLGLPIAAVAPAERVRVACLEQARAAGLSEERAELIADAVFGRLVRAGADSGPVQ